jgi:hypothetical protein
MFTLKFKTDNAAFADDMEGEVSRILTKTARRVADGYVDGPVSDSNGNNIGEWSLDREED